MPTSDLHDLLTRAQAGCPEAARVLVERYSAAIRRVVRRHLHCQLRSLFDSTDFLQLVWADFFFDSLPRESFASEEGLVAYLARVSLNKVHEAHRNHLDTQKRCLRRRVPCPPSLVEQGPTAEQTVDARDDWHELLRPCPPDWQRAFSLLRDGHSQVEVARLLHLSERTLARIIARVRERRGRRGDVPRNPTATRETGSLG